jgi:hypothetical protein
MAVVEELKQKLAEIAAQIQSKRDEIVSLEAQSQAFEAVIRVANAETASGPAA